MCSAFFLHMFFTVERHYDGNFQQVRRKEKEFEVIGPASCEEGIFVGVNCNRQGGSVSRCAFIKVNIAVATDKITDYIAVFVQKSFVQSLFFAGFVTVLIIIYGAVWDLFRHVHMVTVKMISSIDVLLHISNEAFVIFIAGAFP